MGTPGIFVNRNNAAAPLMHNPCFSTPRGLDSPSPALPGDEVGLGRVANMSESPTRVSAP